MIQRGDGMKKPIIGILGRVDMDEDGDQFFASFEKVRLAVLSMGGIPMLLLPVQQLKYYEKRHAEIPALTEEEQQDLLYELDLCDGLLIPGGYRWFANYDAFLAKAAIDRNMPVLGICAGMQMLSTLTSQERITKEIDSTVKHHQRGARDVHMVDIVPQTKLSKLIQKDKISVNSQHRYQVMKADGYTINAYSEDGIIEGIELSDKDFVLAVQWHPETLCDLDDHAAILKCFIQATKNYHENKTIQSNEE